MGKCCKEYRSEVHRREDFSAEDNGFFFHESWGASQQKGLKIILVPYPGLLPPVRWDSNISWLILKSRRMRMDVYPLPTDRRPSSINATQAVSFPCPSLNPNHARCKRFVFSRFSLSHSLASNCRSFLGNWEAFWMLVRKNSSLQNAFPQGWGRLISSVLVILGWCLQLPSFKTSASGLGSAAILDRRQYCEVKSKTIRYWNGGSFLVHSLYPEALSSCALSGILKLR